MIPQTQRLQTAIDEANRFVRAAHIAMERAREDAAKIRRNTGLEVDFVALDSSIHGTKESAAAKRASLDLSRALSAYRRL